jgi:hypothetical protein
MLHLKLEHPLDAIVLKSASSLCRYRKKLSDDNGI